MSTNIDQPTAVIADAHKRWQRNRDVIEGADAVHRVKRSYTRKVEAPVAEEKSELAKTIDAIENKAAQTYAMRVWSGQSVDVPPAERKERVFNALRGQNLSTDGIIFPT